jgi:hypothetical protein
VQAAAGGKANRIFKDWIDETGCDMVKFTVFGNRIIVVGTPAGQHALASQSPYIPKCAPVYETLNTLVRAALLQNLNDTVPVCSTWEHAEQACAVNRELRRSKL